MCPQPSLQAADSLSNTNKLLHASLDATGRAAKFANNLGAGLAKQAGVPRGLVDAMSKVTLAAINTGVAGGHLGLKFGTTTRDAVFECLSDPSLIKCAAEAVQTATRCGLSLGTACNVSFGAPTCASSLPVPRSVRLAIARE